jgi:hypothetical protein
MKRSILFCVLMACAAVGAQQASPSNPYQGTSNPPPDDTIVTSDAAPVAKPSPAKPAYNLATAPSAAETATPSSADATVPAGAQPAAPANSLNDPTDGTDNGVVQIAPETSADQPALNHRALASDPDGDIVHPAPLAPGELGAGATIRVRLLDRLSTAEAEKGDRFRSRVASDVVQDGQVLIPAGAEIDGTVAFSTSGHFGGHGAMRLRPETVVLADGSRYRLYAQIMAAPGAKARVGSEGAITPGSRLKKDGIEYGAAVGGGAMTGGVLAGPGGALAGTIVGASVITVHLLVSHPQADLESGTVLIFSLTQPLQLAPATGAGN